MPGADGMGEVYRARDTRLNRDDAIKVLPAAVGDDADRVARYLPAASFTPALRLSLTPDGRSLAYARVRITANLWLMSGLETVTGK